MMRWFAALFSAVAILIAAGGDALFERAVAELRAADYPAAERDLLQVLASSPKHPGALQNLGLVYSKTGRVDQAIDCYRQALQSRPTDSKLLLDLGLAYLKRGTYTDALPTFQKLLDADVAAARDPGLLYVLIVGYLKANPGPEGKQAVGKLLNSIPPAPASAVLCRIHFESGRYDDAEQQCRRTLAADPQFPGAHRELGKVLDSLHRPEAESELAIAAAQDPSDAQAAYYYGVALLQDGKLAPAAGQLERSRKLDPAFWGSYFYLGKIKLQTEQPSEAVGLLRKAAELNPAGSVVFYELGRALLATGQNEAGERAMQHVRELRAAELARDAEALHRK